MAGRTNRQVHPARSVRRQGDRGTLIGRLFVLRRALILVTLLAVLPALTSCDTDNSERARGAVEVSTVADGGVFICGMEDAGLDKIWPSEDDFVPAGHFPVTLKNRPYNPFITAPDYSPYGHFHVTSVEVEWVSTNPPDVLAQLTPFNYRGGYDIAIPMNSERTFNVMAVPFYMKSSPYFQDLLFGNNDPFTAVANLKFFGHDSGSENTIVVEGSCIVEFIGVIISE
jgi:hypothetical protein